MHYLIDVIQCASMELAITANPVPEVTNSCPGGWETVGLLDTAVRSSGPAMTAERMTAVLPTGDLAKM